PCVAGVFFNPKHTRIAALYYYWAHLRRVDIVTADHGSNANSNAARESFQRANNAYKPEFEADARREFEARTHTVVTRDNDRLYKHSIQFLSDLGPSTVDIQGRADGIIRGLPDCLRMLP